MAVCPVCLDDRFDPLDRIDFGGWSESADRTLTRWAEPFDLGRCSTCGHVMITTPYDAEAFRRIYLDTPQDPVFWDESLAGSARPYEDMVAFCDDRVATSSGPLVDVGCGPGLLLEVLHERCGQPLDRLFGIDFNRRLPDRFAFLPADLNRLRPEDLPSGIGVAFASHLLEHLVDPRHFLRTLGSRLADDGVVYVEVPDNLHVDPGIVGPTNLINQQHIHYFCESTLVALAESCGLSVIRRERSVLGYIPRLRLLLARAARPRTDQAIRESLRILATRRVRLATALRSRLGSGEVVGLWGVGADFHRLTLEHPDLRAFIAEGRIVLFDLGLAGRRIAGGTIRPPAGIAEFPGTVYLTPLLGDVRLKMRRFAAESGIPPDRVVDLFLANVP